MLPIIVLSQVQIRLPSLPIFYHRSGVSPMKRRNVDTLSKFRKSAISVVRPTSGSYNPWQLQYIFVHFYRYTQTDSVGPAVNAKKSSNGTVAVLVIV